MQPVCDVFSSNSMLFSETLDSEIHQTAKMTFGVIQGHSDGHTMTSCTALCIASCGKNVTVEQYGKQKRSKNCVRE